MNTHNTDDKEEKLIHKKNYKKNHLTKDNILFVFFLVVVIVNIYLIFDNPNILELGNKIDEIEMKLEKLKKESINKKLNIAFIYNYLYGNGIARLITVLTDLLVKTGKYNVFLITDEPNQIDFQQNPKVIRTIQKLEEQAIIDFDEVNDIDIYIMNNEISDSIVDIYHSLGKKVVGIFHGVFLSCLFSNHTSAYRLFTNYSKIDSFVHIIPDDYYVYKKLGLSNSIYIPNIYTFDYTKTPSSNLYYKNILMVGRVDDVLKGAKFGILAFAEILKEVPDALLTILNYK